jgi:RNA polymerase sigma factor (sigma-70 family)
MAVDSLEPGLATSQVDVDADLVKKAQAYLECTRNGGVPTAELTEEWERFYHSCDLTIRRFAARCGAESVADCSQEVWKTLLVKLAGFQSAPGRPPFLSWLYRLVRNKAVDQIRDRTRHPTESLADGAEESIPEPDRDQAADWDRQLLRSHVHQVLGELEKQIPEQSYRILYMHWIEGRTMSEIASLLNLSIVQVWERHHRAKRKFRCLFELHMTDAYRYEECC